MIDNVGDFLRSHEIKPSYQRVKIYEYLMESKEHPTVEVIYSALLPGIPTLSKTTVYNTLKVFIEKGIAMAITIDENEVRFDAEVDMHGHFKCLNCQKVFDFDVTSLNVGSESMPGFKVIERQMFFYGLCDKCNHES